MGDFGEGRWITHSSVENKHASCVSHIARYNHIMDASTPRPGFPTTRWSRIAQAVDRDDPAARAALEDLCKLYWYPIYAFIRRKGHDADAALDLTQDFFARLLEQRKVAAADPSKGRFRCFLLRDCSFFLADRSDRDRAARGRGWPVLSIDVGDAESRFQPIQHMNRAGELLGQDVQVGLPHVAAQVTDPVADVIAEGLEEASQSHIRRHQLPTNPAEEPSRIFDITRQNSLATSISREIMIAERELACTCMPPRQETRDGIVGRLDEEQPGWPGGLVAE